MAAATAGRPVSHRLIFPHHGTFAEDPVNPGSQLPKSLATLPLPQIRSPSSPLRCQRSSDAATVPSWPEAASPPPMRSLDWSYCDRARTLGSLTDLELNPLVIVQRIGPTNLGMVDEHIFATVVDSDKAKALIAVEPFDGSLCHALKLSNAGGFRRNIQPPVYPQGSSASSALAASSAGVRRCGHRAGVPGQLSCPVFWDNSSRGLTAAAARRPSLSEKLTTARPAWPASARRRRGDAATGPVTLVSSGGCRWLLSVFAGRGQSRWFTWPTP